MPDPQALESIDIDRQLEEAGWIVQDRNQVNILPQPLAEQERIVEEVERRLSVIEQMGSAVETILRRAESLRQSILRLAFSGRLN
jgi:type I restriction enzyme S subunit